LSLNVITQASNYIVNSMANSMSGLIVVNTNSNSTSSNVVFFFVVVESLLKQSNCLNLKTVRISLIKKLNW